MLKIRNTVTGVVVLAVVVATWLYLSGNPSLNGTRTDGYRVTLVVEFDPQERDKYISSVYIQVLVNEKQVLDDVATLSPWVRRVNVAPGAKLELWASQEAGLTMECFITYQDRPIASGFRTGPGEVKCSPLRGWESEAGR